MDLSRLIDIRLIARRLLLWPREAWAGLLGLLDRPQAGEVLTGSGAAGADTLLQLIKNYARSHDIKRAVTVGVVGYPNVPSIGEVVKDYDFASEVGFLAPAGLPPAVLNKLAAAMKKAAESPDLIESLRKLGVVVNASTPAEYAENIRTNLKKYERAVKIAKIPQTEQ